MNTELITKIIMGAMFFGLLLVWTFFQRRAGEYADGMTAHARAQLANEAKILLIIRPMMGITWYGSIFAWVFFPAWIGWAALPLPAWLSASGVGIVLLAFTLLGWSMNSLGRNFLATLRLAPDHVLVQAGPYRRMRHPMYLALLLYHLGICLFTANWFIGAMGAGLIAVVSLVRIPKEEAMLAERFGDQYRDYVNQTGGLLPKLG